MHKLIFTNNSRDIIKGFITSYKNNFLNRFTDTWIYYEDLIKQNFVNNSKKFYNDIRNNVIIILGKEKILWYKKLNNWNKQTSIVVWNYRIFIEYFDNKLKNIRYIEKLVFNKK